MKPQTRRENFIAKIAGDKDAIQMTPDPNDRMEGWLNAIAENGGGGAVGIVCDLTFEMRESAPIITATMTAGELWSALQSGSSLLFRLASGTTEIFTPLQMAAFEQSGYTFDTIVGEQNIALVAGNADGYPSSGGGDK